MQSLQYFHKGCLRIDCVISKSDSPRLVKLLWILLHTGRAIGRACLYSGMILNDILVVSGTYYYNAFLFQLICTSAITLRLWSFCLTTRQRQGRWASAQPQPFAAWIYHCHLHPLQATSCYRNSRFVDDEDVMKWLANEKIRYCYC